jgi:hypothetical protein
VLANFEFQGKTERDLKKHDSFWISQMKLGSEAETGPGFAGFWDRGKAAAESGSRNPEKPL